MNIIQRQADDFFRKNEFNHSYECFIDVVSKKVLVHKKEIYKIIFLERLFILSKIKYDRHLKYCSASINNSCRFAFYFESVLFFLQNEIDIYEKSLNNKYLKKSERISINIKLNKFIDTFDENTFHSNINYQIFKHEINEMRHYYYLNKKNWRTLFIGKITELQSKGIISSENSETLIAEIDSVYQLKKRDYLYFVLT
jgi:hypothetical protein